MRMETTNEERKVDGDGKRTRAEEIIGTILQTH